MTKPKRVSMAVGREPQCFSSLVSFVLYPKKYTPHTPNKYMRSNNRLRMFSSHFTITSIRAVTNTCEMHRNAPYQKRETWKKTKIITINVQ